MTEKKEQVENKIITKNQNQEEPILLDLVNNQLTINPDKLNNIIKESNNITTKANKLLEIDVNEIDEDEMTKLNKEIKPITKYEKQFTDFEKEVKRTLKAKDQEILDNYHELLKSSNFDQVQDIVRRLRAKQKDFKANRGNKRWDQLKECFNAQMETYPEIPKYAPKTLGNFSYYRVHHDKLVSDAKTKPITNNTIKTLNNDLYNYHEDLNHLLDSTISPAYYTNIIEQYAAEPSTNKMLDLIKETMAQQVKDNNKKIIEDAKLKAKSLLNELFYSNDKINKFLDNEKPENQEQNDFIVSKLNLMKSEGNAILNSLNYEKFINKDKSVDEIFLTSTLKDLIKAAFGRIDNKLKELKTNPKTMKDVAKNEIQEKQNKHPEDKHEWILDYLQVQNWQHIHGNAHTKVIVLNDLFENLTDKSSIWRQNIHSNEDIIDTVKYISNL